MKEQNQIEEMKQILINYAIKHDLCFSFETMRKHAEVLFNANCRIIHDDEIIVKQKKFLLGD